MGVEHLRLGVGCAVRYDDVFPAECIPVDSAENAAGIIGFDRQSGHSSKGYVFFRTYCLYFGNHSFFVVFQLPEKQFKMVLGGTVKSWDCGHLQ